MYKELIDLMCDRGNMTFAITASIEKYWIFCRRQNKYEGMYSREAKRQLRIMSKHHLRNTESAIQPCAPALRIAFINFRLDTFAEMLAIMTTAALGVTQQSFLAFEQTLWTDWRVFPIVPETGTICYRHGSDSSFRNRSRFVVLDLDKFWNAVLTYNINRTFRHYLSSYQSVHPNLVAEVHASSTPVGSNTIYTKWDNRINWPPSDS